MLQSWPVWSGRMTAENVTAKPAPTGAERKVILTCAQPSGRLHLGNYLGAIRNWSRLIDAHECYFGIVDYHAITVPYTPADLRRACLDTVAVYIAAGLDPSRCHLFLQSHVIGHCELAWILGCLTPIGMLERMTQFKDKSKRVGESVGSGLLFYPVLMAADILLYNADLVPVGEDQKQHVELCRDIAQKFNNTFSDTFRVPEVYIPPTGARIRSLQDPEKKMSKSDENAAGCLFLTDEPAVLRKKIMSAVTDSGSEIRAREDKPGLANLLNIAAALSERPVADWETECDGRMNYGQFKAKVADLVVEKLTPIREKHLSLTADRDGLEKVLQNGAEAAQRRANRTMSKVLRKSGFLERPR